MSVRVGLNLGAEDGGDSDLVCAVGGVQNFLFSDSSGSPEAGALLSELSLRNVILISHALVTSMEEELIARLVLLLAVGVMISCLGWTEFLVFMKNLQESLVPRHWPPGGVQGDPVALVGRLDPRDDAPVVPLVGEAVLDSDELADLEVVVALEPAAVVLLAVVVRELLPRRRGGFDVRRLVGSMVGDGQRRLRPSAEEDLGWRITVLPGRGPPLHEVGLEVVPRRGLGEEVLAGADALLCEPVRLVVVGGRELVLDVHEGAPVLELVPELGAAVGPRDLGPPVLVEELG